MTETCGSCKYLGEAVGYFDGECDWHEESGYFQCAVIKHRAEDISSSGNPSAYVTDASGYFAAIRVKEDFGCVLWEAADG